MKSVAKAALGRRESNKSDKLRRIKRAAREHFLTRDFDDATTREIAVRATIAHGTLFLYVSDKRDLLFLVVNDDLDEIVTDAEKCVRARRSVVDNFVEVFGLLYRYFERQPHLSRMILREMIFYERGEQAKRFLAARQRLIVLSSRIVRQGIERGEIHSREDHDFIGWLVFSIYQAEVRLWLRTQKPTARVGLSRLRRALVLFMNGLAPTHR